LTDDPKENPPSIVTPTDRELVWWLLWQVVEKLLRIAFLAGLVYGGWWWWSHRGA
jgi:hypothetical protein